MTKKKTPTASTFEEQWTVVQVASHLGVPYQTARNFMLEGRFGASQYDAETRRLTVMAANVRNASAKKSHRKRRKR
jgi:hypothetical protein